MHLNYPPKTARMKMSREYREPTLILRKVRLKKWHMWAGYMPDVRERASRSQEPFFSPKGSMKASPVEGFGRCGRLCCGSAEIQMPASVINVEMHDMHFKMSFVDFRPFYIKRPKRVLRLTDSKGIKHTVLGRKRSQDTTRCNWSEVRVSGRRLCGSFLLFRRVD
jgi:hypothetical protein